MKLFQRNESDLTVLGLSGRRESPEAPAIPALSVGAPVDAGPGPGSGLAGTASGVLENAGLPETGVQPPEPLPPNAASGSDLEKGVVAAMRTVFDPEIPVNIYELGLIYGLDVTSEGSVHIRMTLTSPSCPAAESLPPEVEGKVKKVPGIKEVRVEIVWEPPWSMERMSEAAKLQLGLL